MIFTIIDQYNSFVSNNFLKKDVKQLQILKTINSTWLDFKKNTFLFSKRKKNGIYLYGSVGSGKTFLLNLFCEYSKVGKKIHFDHLMNDLHSSINTKDHKDKSLKQYVKKLVQDIEILFIDELHVFNIVDALIIKKLFSLFKEKKIFIIVSSNFHPNDLYTDGLQRNDFLPFVDYILDRFKIIASLIDKDYRRLALNQSKTYFTPINKDTKVEFNNLFDRLVDVSSLTSKTIKIKSRSLLVKRCTANVAICDFDFLCDTNLAHDDYNNIAKEFNLIFISEIPQFFDEKRDQCRRFISLIDMLYEQNCSVVLLADKPISALCKITSLSREFERTASRLYEMTIINPS
tara:strand:- start:6744 stop:7781 length:1038 start_codon:yes stop_codon:yes gene_type:complete